MAPPKTKLVIKNIETKDLMRKIFRFFEMEAKNKRNWNITNPLKRLSKATGLSEKTITSYLQESDPVQQLVNTIHKDNVKRQVPVNKKLDEFDEAVVGRMIRRMHENKEVVTMKKLQTFLKEADIEVSLSTVVRTVKRLGFRYSKDRSGKRLLSERQEVRQDVKEEFRPGIGEGIRPDIGEDIKPEIGQDIRPEIEEDTIIEMDEDISLEFGEDTRTEIEEDISLEFGEDIRPEIGDYLRQEFREDNIQDIRQDIKQEIEFE